MKRFLFMVFAAVFLPLTVAATANPGETIMLNNVSQSVNGSSPFEVSSNETGTFLDLGIDQDSGNYNLSINYSQENNTVYEDVEVNRFGNFSFNKDSVFANASVLSGGNINISIKGSGNSAETVKLDSEGNISELNFQIQSPVTTIPGEEVSVVNGFSVPRAQQFGVYNGTVSASGENFGGEDSFNISVNVFDDISPSIDSVSFPDIMALQNQDFLVEASDNLDVENVSADISFEAVRTVENETVLVNRSFKTVDFNQNNQGSWVYNFDDTGEEKSFYYDLRVTDSSGNTASRQGSFNVSRLSSVTVSRTDIEFKDTRPRTDDSPDRKVSEKLFEKSFGKDMEISLEGFSHRRSNSSMSVGIRREGGGTPRFVYRNGNDEGSITVNQEGTYFLEIYSDSQGDSYNGRIQLSPVDQHEELSNKGSIRFSGTVVDPEFPELPEGRSIGEFDGNLEFMLNENDVPTGIRFVGENTDIEDCTSVDSWSQCLPGFTLGQLDEANERMDRLESEAGFWRFWSKFFILLGVGFPLASIYTVYARGTFMVTPKVYKKNVGQIVENLDDLRTGRSSR